MPMVISTRFESNTRTMVGDPRQVLAGLMTLTMLAMLANMIQHDHFDSPDYHLHVSVSDSNKASESDQNIALASTHDGPWKEDGFSLKPCWEKPFLEEADESQGYVTFSLTNGPEYHVSQIANAVVVARYLRAKLVIPDIRGSNPGEKSNFEDVYDVEKFIGSLDGVIQVVKTQPARLSARNLALVKVPNRVNEEHIAENIEPVFRAKGNMIRIATYFPSVNMKRNQHSDSIACLATFGTLEPQTQVRQLVDSMIDRLRRLSSKSNGRFVAVDLRIDILEKRGCERDSAGWKSCYGPEEIGVFLRKNGFDRETTVYVTQTEWDSGLDALKDLFPKTYTKESISEEKDRGLWELVDFYVCSESDVFVAAIPGVFYGNVAGRRIASGKTHILVPSEEEDQFISSHYVSSKTHFAYSCFC